MTDRETFNFLASLINGNHVLPERAQMLALFQAFNFLASLINGNYLEGWDLPATLNF